MATQNTFDFDTYNALMKSANTGLKLWIAQQMLEDAQMVMLKFKSPLLKEATDIGNKIELLREKNKDYLAKRDSAKPMQNDYRTPDEPSTPQHSTSADAGKIA